MAKSVNRLKRPRIFWIVTASVFLFLIVIGVFGLTNTQAAPPQPFPYPHDKHIAQGIPCVYCHSGAYRGSSAGLPTVAKCQGCHANMKASTQLEQDWDVLVKNNTPINWVPVALMPDFVYFSHQPHIKAGVSCSICHGDLSKMTTAQPQKMNMGVCLECHQRTARSLNNPELEKELMDCSTCHK